MKVRSQFYRNIFSNVGGNAINSVLQLVLLAVLAVLGDRSGFPYAGFLTASAIIGIAEVASDFGGRLWAAREFSGECDPRRILRHSVQSKVCYSFAAVAILALLPLNSLGTTEFLLACLVAVTQPSTDPFLWYLRGRERLDIEAAAVLVSRVASAIAVIAAALLLNSLSAALLAWAVINAVRMYRVARHPVVVPIFRRHLAADDADGNPIPDRKTGHVTFSTADVIARLFPIGASLFLTTLYHRLGVLLLDIIGTENDVENFGTAFKLVMAAGFVSTGIVVSSFAALARAVRSGEEDTVRQVMRRKMLLVTLLLAPTCLIGTLICRPIAETFFPKSLVGAGSVMILLLPGMYLSCVNMAMKFAMTAFELNWYDVMTVLFGLLVFTGVAVLLPAPSRAAAVAIGWAVGEAAVMLARVALLRRHERHAGIPFGMICGATAVLTVACGVTWAP